ncbi:MAG TPA: DUF2244 domain-containing protein [Acetobacteraceae bacterium]|nr:DUF2244 domain-containing protein [Acetobacteraceae bacterium]
MDPVLFEAVIVPHRSLSPRGLRILICVICGLCSLTALRFLLIRAWPVIGFSVIEVGLAVLLLWINARRVRETELVLLSESGLEIVRTDASGRKQTVSLPHAWLQVLMEERDGRIPRLLLAARGLRHEIASSLGEAEKRDLAGALSAALHRLHHPIFDNPQLRD